MFPGHACGGALITRRLIASAFHCSLHHRKVNKEFYWIGFQFPINFDTHNRTLGSRVTTATCGGWPSSALTMWTRITRTGAGSSSLSRVCATPGTRATTSGGTGGHTTSPSWCSSTQQGGAIEVTEEIKFISLITKPPVPYDLFVCVPILRLLTAG